MRYTNRGYTSIKAVQETPEGNFAALQIGHREVLTCGRLMFLEVPKYSSFRITRDGLVFESEVCLVLFQTLSGKTGSIWLMFVANGDGQFIR
jgi:hypothetical protein